MEDAAARKARLKALREAAELSARTEEELETGARNGENGADEPENEQGVRFRNYLPRDEELQRQREVGPIIPMFEDPVAKSPTEIDDPDDPLGSIAPKKPNWDLRRDVAKKLDKLERRTQRAMVELLQEEEKRRQGSLEA
eukprot:TRINITY_DN16550_c0_g1_i1.p1 TRINITY_DN16550_c0_g1~~TRINITY_DN16550_c0_g1_i1.p1  ORF type:complete len:140 (-),score=36.00 TRINITY_DN16550_c0_g1_i1:207-626(-)